MTKLLAISHTCLECLCHHHICPSRLLSSYSSLGDHSSPVGLRSHDTLLVMSSLQKGNWENRLGRASRESAATSMTSVWPASYLKPSDMNQIRWWWTEGPKSTHQKGLAGLWHSKDSVANFHSTGNSDRCLHVREEPTLIKRDNPCWPSTPD